MIQYRINVPNVYDNFHILTTALEGVENPRAQDCSITVIEDAYSPDWHFTIRSQGGCTSATFPTAVRMETPDRQISAIRDGINRVICSMENAEAR